MLSSRCILNMKRLVTLKYKQRKTLESKSRKRLRSLSTVSWNSSYWYEYWNTKIASPNALNSKRMKLERSKD